MSHALGRTESAVLADPTSPSGPSPPQPESVLASHEKPGPIDPSSEREARDLDIPQPTRRAKEAAVAYRGFPKLLQLVDHGRPHPRFPSSSAPSAWSLEEDAAILAIYEQDGDKRASLSQQLPGRTIAMCQLRYATLCHRPEWNERLLSDIAVHYQRRKSVMWSHVAEAVKLPERDVETLVWQMGRWEIARRAARTAHRTATERRAKRSSQSPISRGTRVSTDSTIRHERRDQP